MASVFKADPVGMQKMTKGVAGGFASFLHEVESQSKALTPVHGNPSAGGEFKTFAPGEKPIGGTLRRSQHTVVYVNGSKQFGATTDGNGNGVPRWATGRGVEGFCGTNLEYALFVHDGTIKMQKRPFMSTAFVRTLPRLEPLFRAGFERVVGR